MAHAITKRSNGKSEMAYIGEKPWHGLGQQLGEGEPIEKWMVEAGMDWTIQRSMVRYHSAKDAKHEADIHTWADWNVLMRSDTKEPLGMVSDRFKVVQPREVLEFFRDLTEVAGFKLETAGTLYNGRRFWAMASINAEDRIVGNDLVKGRLMFATACDGSMKSIVKNIAERVVCANTLAIALGEQGASEVQVSHRSKFDADAVKQELGIAVDSFTRFIADARTLSKRDVSTSEVSDLLSQIVGEAEEEALAVHRAFQKMMSLFQGDGRGAGMPGVAGTAWGVVNAVTEYYDHHHPARSQSNRMSSAWFGYGNNQKQKAMSLALELVK